MILKRSSWSPLSNMAPSLQAEGAAVFGASGWCPAWRASFTSSAPFRPFLKDSSSSGPWVFLPSSQHLGVYKVGRGDPPNYPYGSRCSPTRLFSLPEPRGGQLFVQGFSEREDCVGLKRSVRVPEILAMSFSRSPSLDRFQCKDTAPWMLLS